MEKRVCKKCNKEFPLSRDFFGSTPSGGFRFSCRACVRAHVANHHKAHPEQLYNRVKVRKEAQHLAEGHYDENDIDKIRKELKDCCAYCGTPLNLGGEIDHKTPIGNRGGTNWPSNLTLACLQCNREKHEKTVEEYLAWRKKRGLSVVFWKI